MFCSPEAWMSLLSSWVSPSCSFGFDAIELFFAISSVECFSVRLKGSICEKSI